MDLSAKSLNPNKRLKEEFVSNLTGSSMLEIAALLLIVPALVLFRQWSSFGSERGHASTRILVGKMNDREISKCKDLQSSALELTKDFAIVILPIILVLTVLAEWVYILAIILIIVLLFCILAKRSCVGQALLPLILILDHGTYHLLRSVFCLTVFSWW